MTPPEAHRDPAPDAPSRTVVVVSYYFVPEATAVVHRLTGMSRHLVDHGWRCEFVVAATERGAHRDARTWGRLHPTARVRRTGLGRTDAGRSRRLRSTWLAAATREAVRAQRDTGAEVVVTTGPPHFLHLVGPAVRSRAGVPWIADLRDPWSRGAWTAGRSPRGALATRRDRSIERATLRRADGVIANTPRLGAMLRRALPELADRLHVVRNGYDPEDYDGLERHPSGRFVHAGQFYGRRRPDALLDALARHDDPPLVDLLGLDLWPTDLSRAVGSRGLGETVRVRGHLPFEDTCQALVDAEALVMVDSPGRRLGVPAKVYEYLGARRPVVALTEADSETLEVLAAAGVPHTTAAPDDAAGIAEALDAVRSLPLGDWDPTAFTRAESMRTLDTILRTVAAPR